MLLWCISKALWDKLFVKTGRRNKPALPLFICPCACIIVSVFKHLGLKGRETALKVYRWLGGVQQPMNTQYWGNNMDQVPSVLAPNHNLGSLVLLSGSYTHFPSSSVLQTCVIVPGIQETFLMRSRDGKSTSKTIPYLSRSKIPI